MTEFLLLIQTKSDPREIMSAEEHQNHIRKVGAYIARLREEGKLFSAQPLELSGATLQGSKGGVIKDGPFVESKEVIVGYYHFQAKDMEEAIEIAKANPVFEDFDASMEIRPIMKELGIN